MIHNDTESLTHYLYTYDNVCATITHIHKHKEKIRQQYYLTN